MEKTLLETSIFLFICIWGFTILFLWFRPRIELFWKIIATLIYAFYLWFFYREIQTGYELFTAAYFDVTVRFIKELITLIFMNLFFLWPLALVIIFYKASDMGAERLLKFMCIITLILWIIFVIYVFYQKGIDEFLFENLKKMIPDA